MLMVNKVTYKNVFVTVSKFIYFFTINKLMKPLPENKICIVQNCDALLLFKHKMGQHIDCIKCCRNFIIQSNQCFCCPVQFNISVTSQWE